MDKYERRMLGVHIHRMQSNRAIKERRIPVTLLIARWRRRSARGRQMRGFIRCATFITPLRRLVGDTEQTHGSPVRVHQCAIRLLGRAMSPIRMQFRDNFLRVGVTRIRRIARCRRLPFRKNVSEAKTGTRHPLNGGRANRRCEDLDVSSWPPTQKTSPCGIGPFSTSRALYRRRPRSKRCGAPLSPSAGHQLPLRPSSGHFGQDQIANQGLPTLLTAKPLEYLLPTKKPRISHEPRPCPPASPLQIAYRPIGQRQI